jgi:regulatory protein YycI of two-component signal transduction system YycFG
MDSQTALLVSSVVINVLLIIERFMKRITKSKCCGSEITLEPSKSSADLNLSNIKIDESLPNTTNK